VLVGAAVTALALVTACGAAKPVVTETASPAAWPLKVKVDFQSSDAMQGPTVKKDKAGNVWQMYHNPSQGDVFVEVRYAGPRTSDHSVIQKRIVSGVGKLDETGSGSSLQWGESDDVTDQYYNIADVAVFGYTTNSKVVEVSGLYLQPQTGGGDYIVQVVFNHAQQSSLASTVQRWLYAVELLNQDGSTPSKTPSSDDTKAPPSLQQDMESPNRVLG
jgi:hypothetical protein